MDLEDTPIEDNLPTDEESQRLRQERMTKIGELPMDYGIFTVILSPDKNIIIQADGLALFEIAGLLEFARIRMTQTIVNMNEDDEHQSHAHPSETIIM